MGRNSNSQQSTNPGGKAPAISSRNDRETPAGRAGNAPRNGLYGSPKGKHSK